MNIFDCFFELDDSSGPVFHSSVSNVLSDVQFNAFDIHDILCKVGDRFTLTS